MAIAVGEWLGPEVLQLKDWIASLGPKGPLIFLVLFVLLSSIFVPDTVFIGGNSTLTAAVFIKPVIGIKELSWKSTKSTEVLL